MTKIKKQRKARLIHPRCKHCGAALYKTKEKGQQAKSGAPYVFCRSSECPANKKMERSDGILNGPKNPPPYPHQSHQERIRQAIINADGEQLTTYRLLLLVLIGELGYNELAGEIIADLNKKLGIKIS